MKRGVNDTTWFLVFAYLASCAYYLWRAITWPFRWLFGGRR